MTFIASVPFQYDPNASGINDIPYVSGIESSMAWMDSVVIRHGLSGPLVDSSGFKWHKYYSEDNSERVYPQLGAPFALEGMPMNVSGFWGQFNEKIAFLGRETGGDYDNRPFTNHANNIYWSGDYRDPVFPWSTSGNNTKPLPEGMFEYGQIDQDDFNTYIKKYAGSSINFVLKDNIRRRILGNGHAQDQVGIIQYPTMDSQSDFTETTAMNSGSSDELIEVKERHVIRNWSVTEDTNVTYKAVKEAANNDSALNSGVPWLTVEHYIDDPGMNTYTDVNWFWQLGQGSGFYIPSRIELGRPTTIADIHEDYYARSFTVINDKASTFQLNKSTSFAQAPTEVIYSLKKRLALQGSGYDIYSTFSPAASSVSICSSTDAIGNYNLGYKMGNADLSTAGSKALLYSISGYDVFHTEGPITNGTPFFKTNGDVDDVFLDPDTSNRCVYLTNKLDDLDPQTAHPIKTASWWSYFVEQITEVSGAETARELIATLVGVPGPYGNTPGRVITTQVISGCVDTRTSDIYVPIYPSGTYTIPGAMTLVRDWLGNYRGQSASRSAYTPPSGEFNINGPGSFFRVDDPIDIFNSGRPITGPYFNL